MAANVATTCAITTDYSREFNVDKYLTRYAPKQTRKMHDFFGAELARTLPVAS